ncbi:hypothetical protein C8Q79DRAFT_154367 [Trametes meyenii]|nr:hypothetical protein C8Q79DRAFT_154367 [Trametes meyenii]
MVKHTRSDCSDVYKTLGRAEWLFVPTDPPPGQVASSWTATRKSLLAHTMSTGQIHSPKLVPLVTSEPGSRQVVRSASTTAARSGNRQHPKGFNTGFVDIFDVPARLGGPTPCAQHMGRDDEPAIASSQASGSRDTPNQSRSAVTPLPPPVIFDGPARSPAARSVVPHRVSGHQTTLVDVPTRSPVCSPAAPHATPQIFTAPSRPRAYVRSARRMGRTKGTVVMSIVPLIVSGIGVGVLLGVD